MTNEQQAAYLSLLRDQIEDAILDGQVILANDHPETVGIFKALNTNAFKPLKMLVKKIDQQIDTLKPSFP